MFVVKWLIEQISINVLQFYCAGLVNPNIIRGVWTFERLLLILGAFYIIPLIYAGFAGGK